MKVVKITLTCNPSAGKYASKLYNCGSLIYLVRDTGLHLRWTLQNVSKLSSQTAEGPAIKFFQHIHLPFAADFLQLKGLLIIPKFIFFQILRSFSIEFFINFFLEKK